MKLFWKFLVPSCCLMVLICLFRTEFVSNTWGLLIGAGYEIPKESSMFSFKVTMMNTGNGEYWLYGEDKENYYTSMLDNGHGMPYQTISKVSAAKINGFDNLDFTTWRLEEYGSNKVKQQNDQ